MHEPHEITLCEECDNVHSETRKKLPTQWLCMAHKRVEGGSFVAPRMWTDSEPYLRCVNLNGGACPCFTPKRNGPLK